MLPGMIPTFASPTVVAPGAVRADQPHALRAQDVVHAQHVEGGDALGDADDQRDAGVGRLEHGVGGERRRDEDAGARWRRSRATASTTVSKTGTRPSSAVWPPLPGVTPATIWVPYSSIARRVEFALAAGDALDQQARVAADQDAHAGRPGPRRGHRLARRRRPGCRP